MSCFSDLFKYYIEKKKINVSDLSKYCHYDPSTMRKFIQGKRHPSSLSMVKQISQFINLTLNETNEFQSIYYQDLLGEKTYSKFQSTLEFILHFNSTNTSRNSFGEIHYTLENPKGSLPLNSFMELTKAINHLLLKSTESNKKVNLILQPGNTPMNDFFISLMAQLSLDVTHILCLSNNETNTVHYNISCLKQTLSFLSHLNQYEVFYYHDDVQARFHNAALFPFLLLTENGCISFNSDFNTGIYYTSTDLVSLYQREFDQLLLNCHPLYQIIHGIMEEYTAFSQLQDNFSSLQCQPCFISLLSQEIINRIIIQELPQREIVIRGLNQYISLQKQTFMDKRVYSYFTENGINYFADTGKITEAPDAVYHPLNINERIEIISKMIPYVKNGQYKLLKRDLSHIDLNFHLSIHNETTLSLFGKKPNHQLFLVFLEEPQLFSVFKDFFEHLDTYDYIASVDEGVNVFNNAILKLKSMI